MSFFSDLAEGHFNKLGTDITHAPSSLINHPDQLAETLGGAALVAAPFAIPALGSALGFGGTAAAEGAADLGAGAAAEGADLGAGAVAGGEGAAEAGAIGAAETGTAIGDALALAPESADALGLGGAIAAAPENAFAGLGSNIPDAFAVGEAPVAADVGATAPQFASTDAELTGGITGDGTTVAGAGAGSNSGSFLGNAVSKAGDWLANPANDLKLALGVAPLALTLARGEASLPGQIGPAQANATALANQGANLNASQQATLNQQRQDALNAMRQALFNQGVTNPEADTRYAQYTQLVDQQVTASATQMIQNNIQNSLAGDQQLIQIAGLQMNSDNAFTTNLVNATKALGTVAGLGSGVTLKVA